MSSSPTSSKPNRAKVFFAGAATAFIALASFAYHLSREPHFMDESAYLSQTYFAKLFAEGKVHDVSWIEYPGIDLPPLAKYSIGLAVSIGGERFLTKGDARRWYLSPGTFQPETAAMLYAGRWSSVVFGVLGVASLYAIGVMASGRISVGLGSAFLLIANPLFRMHARRAMADAPVEGLMLLSLALGLWFWKRAIEAEGIAFGRLSLAALAGVVSGLAVAAKLNGGLAVMAFCSWCLLGMHVASNNRIRIELAAGFLLFVTLSFATFVLTNPTIYAHPQIALTEEFARVNGMGIVDRTKLVIDHRAKVASSSASGFIEATPTFDRKAGAFFVQGFGRFGPMGPSASNSRIRYDPRQDWGAVVWLPIVLAGFGWCAFGGRLQARDGRAPSLWCVGVHAFLAWVVVITFLPLAWDRYFLSIQPCSAILAAGVIDATIRFCSRKALGRTTT